MSIRVMANVWERAPHSGPKLLMLLALADFCDDEGACYPSVARLATKTRVTERRAQQILHELEAAGDILIIAQAGKRHRGGATNRYVLVRYVAPAEGVKVSSPPEETNPLKELSPGEILGQNPLKELSPESSIEPSSKDSLRAPAGASPSTPIEAAGPADPSADPDADETNAPTLYPCADADINALIAAWYEWVPRRPTKRGAVLPAKAHYANRTNREYARNLAQRGVMPADFARVLGDIRFNDDSTLKHFREREMTFCLAGEIVEQWVRRDRAENWYTPDAPRITPRRPGVRIHLDEVMDVPLEQLMSLTDIIVDLPRPYIDPNDVNVREDDEDAASGYEIDVSELEIPL